MKKLLGFKRGICMITKNIIEIKGWVLWTNLKDGSNCPKCGNPLKLHGYCDFGGHKLECYKCGFMIEGIKED